MSSSLTEAVQVVMPQMGVSVAEGTVADWRKQPGDEVAADETLCEVTTDKIDVEIPAPASGRLGRILVGEGETVAVGTPMAEIEVGGDGGQQTADSGEVELREDAAPVNGEIDRSGFRSPVVRRIAAEHDVDLERVTGHGVGGRVTKQDLVAFIEETERDGTPVLHSDSPYVPDSPAPAPAAPAAPDANGSRREPLSAMRRAIGRHMVESRRTSAHCTTIVEADFSALRSARDELRASGTRATYLAFVSRVVIDALGRHPVLNASIDGDDLVLHEGVNLGIAVALEQGLIVPVVRDAQRLSVEGLAVAIAELAGRAREGRLEPDETHGGTFTITNPGRFGALLATPIINQPEVAILDLEAVVSRPVVVTDEAGNEAIAIRPMGHLCMSWDHRALDGAQAARFLGEIKEGVERWSTR